VVGSYLSVLFDVVTVVGDSTTFVAVVAASVVLAGVLRALPAKYAFGLAATLLAAGMAFYLLAVPPAYFAVLSPSRVVGDTIALLTGYSVMRMPAAGVWAVAVAPAPTFLATYFTARTEYARAAGVASLALGFFVLTGDSNTTTTLVGVLAAAGAVGFGTLAAHGASARQTQVLAVVLAVMILGSATVTAVPGGRSPLVPSAETSAAGSLVSAEGYVGVGGSLRLDPKVQFVVESEHPSYYRAAVYDRFTGNGWVQTADVGTDNGEPPPTGRRIKHRVTAKRTLDVLPSAPVPRSASGVDAQVDDAGLLQSGPTLSPGDSYSVVSRAPVDDRSELVDERGGAPEQIRDVYLQLPDSTSEKVVDLADRITGDSASNYRQAEAIEQWLEANKQYSLDAKGTRGNLVNEFVLQRNVGYCTYYASSMVVMLRSQGVPARFVTGYTEGQRVSEDQWVVRGLDSHAWVEVYVPDHGWVQFDPTPASERSSAEDQRVLEARSSGLDGVDAAGSANGTWTPTTTQSDTPATIGSPGGEPLRAPENSSTTDLRTPNQPANVTAPALGGNAGSSGGGPALPPLTTLAVWAVLLVGAAAVLQFTGLSDRAYRALWLRWLPNRDDPGAEIEAAFERVEYVLSKRYRPRTPGETVREYVADVRAGERAERVAALREVARYAGRADAEDAAEAKRLARSLAAEYSRLPTPWR